MPSTLTLSLLSAVTLAFLAAQVTGSPVPSAPSEVVSGETSGEELVTKPSVKPSKWEQLIKTLIHEVTKLRNEQFVETFEVSEKQMESFKDYKISSPSAGCPNTNFNKEACLQQLIRGLQEYSVLLKHVHAGYPRSKLLAGVTYQSSSLLQLLTEKLKDPESQVELSASEQEQLLNGLSTATAWDSHISVHVILRELAIFLIDAKRALLKMELRDQRRARTPAPLPL